MKAERMLISREQNFLSSCQSHLSCTQRREVERVFVQKDEALSRGEDVSCAGT